MLNNGSGMHQGKELFKPGLHQGEAPLALPTMNISGSAAWKVL
jgi:hypothetical protein